MFPEMGEGDHYASAAAGGGAGLRLRAGKFHRLRDPGNPVGGAGGRGVRILLRTLPRRRKLTDGFGKYGKRNAYGPDRRNGSKRTCIRARRERRRQTERIQARRVKPRPGRFPARARRKREKPQKTVRQTQLGRQNIFRKRHQRKAEDSGVDWTW